MNIYFRTNFNSKLGIGHLSRVYNLYCELKKTFSCKIIIDKKQNNIPFFSNDREFIFLYDKQKFFSENNDANLFISEISKTQKNIIITDDYRLGYKWERKVYPYCYKLIAIDDFIYKKHHVDILINTKPELSNLDLKTFNMIKRNNKRKTIFLLGKEYSITNQFFSQKYKQRKNNFLTLTFYNGGSGNILIYEKIINYIIRQRKKLIINLICGPLARNVNLVIKKYKKRKNIKIINNYDDFLKSLTNTNLFVGSCGVISFELARICLPSILLIMNKNQEANQNEFEDIGHHLILKKKDLKNFKKFATLIMLCLDNHKRIKKMMELSGYDKSSDGKKLIIKSILKK